MKPRNKIFVCIFIFIALFSVKTYKVEAAIDNDTDQYYCKYQNSDPSSTRPKMVFVTYEPNNKTNDGYVVYRDTPSLPSNMEETIFHTVAEEIGFSYDTKVQNKDALTCPKYLYYVDSTKSYGEAATIHYTASNGDKPIDDDATLLNQVLSPGGTLIEKAVYTFEGKGDILYENNSRAGSCTYKDNDGGQAKLSIDNKGNLKINVQSKKSGDATPKIQDANKIKDMLQNRKCPAYAVAENDFNDEIYFGDSEESIINTYGASKFKNGNGSAIYFSGGFYSTDLKDAEALLNQAEADVNTLNELLPKYTELMQQYENNNCDADENSENQTCKDLKQQIISGLKELEAAYDAVTENDQAIMVSGYEELVTKVRELLGKFKSWGFNISIYNGSALECSDLQEFGIILLEVFKVIRAIATVLFIVLGALDFVKATVSSDQDLMKKATSNFIKRGIAFIILFFLPIILNIILKLADINPNDPLCNDVIKFW